MFIATTGNVVLLKYCNSITLELQKPEYVDHTTHACVPVHDVFVFWKNIALFVRHVLKKLALLGSRHTSGEFT